MKADLASGITLLLTLAVSSSGITGVTDESDPLLDGLIQLLAEVDEAAVQLDLLRGMREGLEGRRNVLPPDSWAKARAKLRSSESTEVREEAMLLAVRFGDASAVEELRRTLHDTGAATPRRLRALTALVGARVARLGSDLRALLADRALRGAALRSLAAYEDAETPAAILEVYSSLGDTEKSDAISTLASRRNYARSLLRAVEDGTVAARELSSVTARQLRAFEDAEIDAQLDGLWGRVRSSSEERRQLIARYEKLLTPEVPVSADLASGRRTFARVCGSCHKMYGVGGDVGPELTGSDRRKLLYILENVLDPNAVVADAYRMATVVTTRGRVISGILRESNEQRLVVQTTNEQLTIPAGDVLRSELSAMSIMPEGLFRDLTLEEVRDLVAYLATDRQVPLPGHDG